MRSACAGEEFYREHKGKRYCVLHYPGKDKGAVFEAALRRKMDAGGLDFFGVWFPNELILHDFEFSAAANFTCAHFSGWAEFSNVTFAAGASFGHVCFVKGASFAGAIFRKGEGFFSSTVFGETIFGGTANFLGTTFDTSAHFDDVQFVADTYFRGAIFGKRAGFRRASFVGEADFRLAQFNSEADLDSSNAKVDFCSAKFDGIADFTFASFIGTRVDFSQATFGGSLRFSGGKGKEAFDPLSSLSFQGASIDKPDRVSFHTVTLRPHWFINVDARQFQFTSVEWAWPGGGLNKRSSITQEINALQTQEVSSPRLLSIVCRQLAVNAEENHRYEEASNFRYWSMDARRRARWRGWAVWTLDWWYWALSGYGEHIGRAATWLILILGLFAGLYTRVGFVGPASLTTTVAATSSTSPTPVPTSHSTSVRLEPLQALVYSFEVSTLQKPEPRPLTLAARWCVGLETVLGPLQAALLALAVRRKFMR